MGIRGGAAAVHAAHGHQLLLSGGAGRTPALLRECQHHDLPSLLARLRTAFRPLHGGGAGQRVLAPNAQACVWRQGQWGVQQNSGSGQAVPCSAGCSVPYTKP